MSERSERWDRVTRPFTDRVGQVPPERWDDPAPCEGWVARDVVRHLVEWVPGLLSSNAAIDPPAIPSVDDDPVGAWAALRDWVAPLVDDEREIEVRGRRWVLGDMVDAFVTGDVLLHTWDLARATGLDERLDPDEVHRMYEGMLPMDEVLRSSGHYGPRVEVPDDADEQARLIAFTGRTP